MGCVLLRQRHDSSRGSSKREYGLGKGALLAAVLPAPTQFKANAPSGYVKKRQAWIERQMRALGGTSYLAQLR